MNGFSFSYRDIAFKASQLGKAYSWVNLQKQLNYNPDHLEALRATKEAIPAPAPAPAPAGMVIKTAKETLTISEKIASLSSSRAVPLPVAASLAPALASKKVVEEDKRQRIISAVLDLQNSQRRNKAKPPRFLLWLPFLSLLKILGFCLIHTFKKFKRVLKAHALTPSIQTQLTANIKNHK